MLSGNHRLKKHSKQALRSSDETSPTGSTERDQVIMGTGEEYLTPAYAARGISSPISKYVMPETSVQPEVAAQIIKDELNLDGNATLNLASFVTTWMDRSADELIMSTLNKNFVDAEEYPQTVELHDRCVNMLATLFHSPHEENYMGCATVGSSEAIHLAGLAMKWNWKKKMEALNKPTTNPNIVMGQNVQVCWEKFARYFEVEPRYVPMEKNRYIIDPAEAMKLVDENTIGVVGILGSTYTGEYEPIEELSNSLDDLEKKTGLDVVMHVDAASGGFVAPFLQPELKWDFRLSRVVSINTSGHKYGLVYPGIGWVIWRDPGRLPEELIFHVSYLGGDHPTFQLNFSRGASQVIAQYYNFIRLGKNGYKSVMESLSSTAKWISTALGGMGYFDIVHSGNDLPVVCIKVKDGKSFDVFQISDLLKQRGWIVPAYAMAPNAQDVSVLRIVVREGLSLDLAQLLIRDIDQVVTTLESQKGTMASTTIAKPTDRSDKALMMNTDSLRLHKIHRGVC